MSGGEERPLSAEEFFRLGRAYWLPPDGHGDGLDALTWAQLARIPHADAERVLAALGEHGIPGWVAPVDRHAPDSDITPYDVWVATIDIDAAEDVAMAVLGRRPGHEPG